MAINNIIIIIPLNRHELLVNAYTKVQNISIDGKKISSINEYIQEGDNILSLPLNMLTEGIYIISVQHLDGVESLKLDVRR